MFLEICNSLKKVFSNFIVRIHYRIQIIKICVDRLLMLLVMFPVNSRLLAIKLRGISGHTWFCLQRDWRPEAPCCSEVNSIGKTMVNDTH